MVRSLAGWTGGLVSVYPALTSSLYPINEERGISSKRGRLLLFVGSVKSQQHACVSQGWICSDKRTCCREVADPTSYLTQSQYTDTEPTTPSADPFMPGAWQGSHWSANFEVNGMTRPGQKSCRTRDSNPRSSIPEADALTTRPARRSCTWKQVCRPRGGRLTTRRTR